MSEQLVVRRFGLGALVALIAMSLLALAPRANAATVVNGDFEAGTLTGWETFDEGAGEWTTYSGSNPFSLPLSAPPQGVFAAATVQEDAGLHILYQEVDLGTGPEEVLRLYAYYASDVQLDTPESGTLSPGAPSNQQYRIDVMDPTAPLNSVDPEDILAPVFATETGDPQTMAPKLISVDLTKFAGQTVGLRMAEVDNQGFFNAAVDAVTIGPPPPPPPTPSLPAQQPVKPAPPSNAFTFGKLKLNKKNGTATLQVNVPGAGTLTAVDAKKKAPKRIRKATATAAAAGVVTLKLKATGAGMETLKDKGKLQFKALVTFTPTGGVAASQTRAGKLKLK